MASLARVFCRPFVRQRLAALQSLSPARNFYLYSPEPFHPIKGKEPQWMSADEAVGMVRSNSNVYVHGGVCTPKVLLEALGRRGKSNQLRDIKLWSILLQTELMDKEYEDIFRVQNLFITGEDTRDSVADGRSDYIPIFLSEIPLLFRRNLVKLDVALIQVTPPDRHGYCSLGASVDATRCAIQNAKYIIAQVNPQMPRTFGDGNMHMSHLDALVEGDGALPTVMEPETTPAEEAIGRLIATCLVQDGATIQVGIGSVPHMVLKSMNHHRDIGIHSELFDDDVIDLVDNGVITNARKSIHTGKIVSSIAIGTPRLYEFIDNNPFIIMNDVAFVNNVSIIMQNPKVTAINSCIEIDLTGQVVADSIGTRIYSGVGGQIDFLRGAAQCTDGLGKPIIGLPSTTNTGESRIVPVIKHGAGVVTTRAHVHYIVTEFGIAYLFGKNIRQRAYEMIRLAHPDHREELEKAAFERLKCMPSPD